MRSSQKSCCALRHTPRSKAPCVACERADFEWVYGRVRAIRPNFNTTRDKSVSAQALTRARAALSTTLWRSALCLGRLGLGDFADVGWQRDTDRLEDMADVAGNWCAQ